MIRRYTHVSQIPNSHLGYYRYQNEYYTAPADIYDTALARKDYYPRIEYLFHEDVYNKFDTEQEPDISLEQLYVQRAWQLREENDYLILSFSGGSDSTQILHTFLKNNIKLDEVHSFYPKTLLKALPASIDEMHPHALLHEYQWACRPVLEQLAKTHPEIKIVDLDYTSELRSYCSDENLAFNLPKHVLSSSLYIPARNMFYHDFTQKYISGMKHRKVGVIRGSDKPLMHVYRNDVFFSFCDFNRSGWAIAAQTDIGLSSNYNPIMFYWSPSCPLLTIKQAHVMKNEMQYNPEFRKFFVSDTGNRFPNIRKSLRENMMSVLLYPDWNASTFQKRIKTTSDESIITDLLPELHWLDKLKEKNAYYSSKYKNIANMNDINGEAALKNTLPLNTFWTKKYKVGTIR